MSNKRWKHLPVDQARRYLEPGPVVLLSTAHKHERAIMTLGWHMMLGYDLVGTYLWQANRSHALARASRECVINLPTEDLLDTVVRIGNCSSTEQDKFGRFGLTALPSRDVDAPGIGECHARFECRLSAVRVAHRPCPRRHLAPPPAYRALPRRRPLHGVGPGSIAAAPVPAGHAGAVSPWPVNTRLGTLLPWPSTSPTSTTPST
jgi:flavin reductase (DIM6/NTAB) family NADH-FMN oxidoreductase RutF